MGAGVRRPIALVILDGWGINDSCDHNAVCQARTPNLDALFREFPSTRMSASGMDVGLPEGQMGNSEVGHLNIGAGRIVYQDLTRISKSIEDGDFFQNPTFLEVLGKVKASGGRLHLMGLLSDGGVHSHMNHACALVEMAGREGVRDVYIHAFLDGRDTPPKSGAGFLAELENRLEELGIGRIATVIGRFYAMDRDNRWDRVERAYRAMTEGEGITASSATAAVQAAYEEGQTDEFIEPRVLQDQGRPVATVDNGDAVIFFNFRSDRAREMTRALTEEDFNGFTPRKRVDLAGFVCMAEYDETFDLPVAFPPESHRNIIGEVIARAGRTQLRIAETEKYAHVTFFFNGGSEVPFPEEERILIPSPRDVSTYDQKPEMSAPAVTDEVVRRVAGGKYDFIVLNYANPDMVGHTGIQAAAIAAMETVDACVGRVVDAILEAGGSLLLTSDHGNCEQLADSQGHPHTAHTANPVPLILVDPHNKSATLRPGILADIAPTILYLMDLEKPFEMTGRNLLAS